MRSQIKKISEYFSQNKENKLTEKNLLSLLQENFTWIKNISQSKTNLLYIKKRFLFRKNFSYSETNFLNQDKVTYSKDN